MKKTCKYILALASSLLPIMCFGASAWLPPPGRLDLSLGFGQETFRQFWQGTQRVTLANIIVKNQYYGGFVYGLTDRFAIDLLTGAGNSKWAAGTRGNLGGRLDTDVGLLYRAIDETTSRYWWMPTTTFRAGGTIKGTYALANANAPANLQGLGNKVNGTQLSILLGKFLPHNVGLFGEFGWRYRGSPVPNALFGNVGVLQTIFDHWTWSIFYNTYRAVSGLDIGKAPFTGVIGPFGLQATKEQTGFMNGSLTYGFNGGQAITLVYAYAVSGRNSGVQSIPSLFVTLPIQTR